MNSKAFDVRETTHTLDNHTKGFFLTDHGKDLFFTVTDPDYNFPKATLLYFHGPNEFSELMGDQIDQWTKAGYRVVTFDMPGAGRSSKDAAIGDQDLVHMNSVEEQAQAVTLLVDHLQNNYTATQNGRLHFVGYSTGALVAMETLERLPAGAVGSLTAISPLMDIDLGIGGTLRALPGKIRTAFDGASDPSGVFTTDQDFFYQLGGYHLARKSADFRFSDHMHADRTGGTLTKGYVEAIGRHLDKVNPDRDSPLNTAGAPDIKKALINNHVGFAVIADPEAALTGEAVLDWVKQFDIPAKLTLKPGDGPDLHHNPETAGEVLAAIEANTDDSLYVKIVNKLQNLQESDWKKEGAGGNTGLSKQERREMQKSLEAMGYDVGKYGIDGVPSFGQVADTEHALTQFLVTYLDKTGQDFDRYEFTPENIANTVQMARDSGFFKPDLRTLHDPNGPYDQLRKNGGLDQGRQGQGLARNEAAVSPPVMSPMPIR